MELELSMPTIFFVLALAVSAWLPTTSHAQNIVPPAPNGFEKFWTTTLGANTQSVSFGSGGQAVTATKFTTGTPLGNMGVFVDPAGSKGLEVRGTANVPLPAGRTAPMTVVGKVTPAALTKLFGGLISLVGGPFGAAVAVGALAYPHVMDWMSQASVRLRASGTGYEQLQSGGCSVAPCFVYEMTWGNPQTGVISVLRASTYTAVAAEFLARGNAYPPVSGYRALQSSLTEVLFSGYWVNAGGSWAGSYSGEILKVEVDPVPPAWVSVEKSVFDVALSSQQPDPWVLSELYNKANSAVDMTNVVLSGTTFVPGPEVVEILEARGIDPAGTRVTKTDFVLTPVGDKLTTVEQTTETFTQSGIDPATGQPFLPQVTKTTTKESLPETTPQEAKPTCGLPDTPACKIDETGTLAPVAADKFHPDIESYKTDREAALVTISGTADKPFFSGWDIFWSAPPVVECVPYVLPPGPGMASSMGSINPCPVVDGMRYIMGLLWAVTALFMSVGMVRKVI